MKTNLEELSPVKKKLSIEIESKEVDKKLNEAYRELGKKAKIPGFRPGKVPRKILETHFSTQVTEDVTKNLISETFPMAIQEVETFPLGAPLLEKDILKQGQNFKYSAVMEVRPKFEVKDYLELEVEKERLSVSEEDVRKQLEQIREANGPLEGIKSPNFLLKVGSNEFHPGFDEALTGLHKEDETEIRVDFEKDHYHSKLAGKSLDFKVKITDIKEMVLSELNDEFAQNLGADIKDLEDLKNKVKESITAQEEKRIDRDLKQRILKKISDSVDFELPQILIESEIDYAVENVAQNLIRSGSSLEKAGLSEEKLREEFTPSAQKRVKGLLILGEIAKQDNIEVDEEDLANSLRDLAANTGQDMETIRKYYEAKNMIGSLKEKLLEEKTLNYLVKNAKISEVDEKGEN
jgi:trigger factor